MEAYEILAYMTGARYGGVVVPPQALKKRGRSESFGEQENEERQDGVQQDRERKREGGRDSPVLFFFSFFFWCDLVILRHCTSRNVTAHFTHISRIPTYMPHSKQKRHTSVDREFSARHVTITEHSPLYNAYPSPSADPGVDPGADPVSVSMQRGDSGVGSMQQSRHEDTETDLLERRMSDVSMDDVLMGDAIEVSLREQGGISE